MSETPQQRALKRYRKRLAGRGMARFEVLGLDEDRELIRALAKRLAEDGPEAAEIRDALSRSVEAKQSSKGGIWRAIRSSPLVGADLDLTRPFTSGRKAGL